MAVSQSKQIWNVYNDIHIDMRFLNASKAFSVSTSITPVSAETHFY